MRKSGLALIAPLILYAMFVSWTVYEYNTYVANLMARYPPELRPWIDPLPYTSFWYAQWVLILPFPLVFLVFGVLLFCGRRKKKILLAIIMLLPLLLVSQVHATVEQEQSPFILPQASKQCDVNTLIYFDEECTDVNMRKQYYQDFFTYISTSPSPARGFKDNWNIRLYPLNDWNSFWDSDDSQKEAVLLLQEAIRELGGVWDPANKWWVWQPKVFWVNGWPFIADFLLVLSNQGINARGFSMPEWNAMILSFDVFPNRGVELHELSHQFWCYHCSNYCVMNPTWTDLMWGWCSDCFNTITNNREKWGYKNWFYIEPTFDGSTSPTSGFWYQSPTGTMVMIQAFPEEEHSFEIWAFYSPDFNFLFSKSNNPFTFPLDMDYYIVPIFYPQYPIACFGGGGKHYLR